VSLGLDAVVVMTPFEDFTVRVERGGPRPAGEQLELARWAAREFRVGIDMGDPAVARAAQELIRLLDGTGSGFGFSSRPDTLSPFGNSFGSITTRLEEELLAGRLVVERERFASPTERRDLFEPKLPPLPPARRESKTHTFEIRFVDEVGKAISGIDAEFTTDSAQTRPINAAGIALLEGVKSSSANVAILDPEALAKVLDPRWENFRPGKPPKESNTTEAVFRGGELGPFPLKAELPNTVVIKPPLGKLCVELWDKTGRVRHANRTYQITGPQSFEGTTDEDGRLLHEDVIPGDYSLSLALDFFEGDPDRVIDIVDSALVVLEPTVSEPQVRRLGVAPHSILVRLRMFFNTNKAFLLPTALPSLRKLRGLYIDNAPCELLVVGHADTKGGATFNDKLSFQRAEATIAYLKDDVEAWFRLYSVSDPKQCWGKVEDHLMIISMPDFETKPQGDSEVRWFQRTRELQVDGDAGEKTRKALIAEYMSLDGASLKDFVGEINAVAHGCGENFPLDDAGEELDKTPADEKRDPGDRRVELYFFDAEFGITPKPPSANASPGSPEYPKWRARVVETVELKAGDPEAAQLTFVELSDAHFRTNSAVVLPEGENPGESGEHPALTSVGLIANALRFNDEHPGRSMLVAGHTDSAASESFNQKLSEERAKVAFAMLKGGSDSRTSFGKLCDGRHTTTDIQQILSWVARAFPGFDCDPGKLDGVARKEPVRKFQLAYNANKATLNPDPTAANLLVDGTVGELTWQAFFDCYEAALKDELGEDDAGVADLRTKVVFADEERESLGFGELFPIEELGVDEFRSQTNRRVELLFFEPGEEPDLAHAQDDPETSELYLPGRYDRTALQGTPTAKRPNQFDVHVRALGGVVSTLRLTTDGGFEQTRTTDDAEPDDVEIGLFRIRFEKLPDIGLFSLFMQNAERPELILFSELPFSALTGAGAPTLSLTPTEDVLDVTSEADDFDPDSYLSDYS